VITTFGNSRWKSILDWESLEAFLRNNPGHFLYDTRDKEHRYVVRPPGPQCGGQSVDGRSIVWCLLERFPDGGYQLREGKSS